MASFKWDFLLFGVTSWFLNSGLDAFYRAEYPAEHWLRVYLTGAAVRLIWVLSLEFRLDILLTISY